MVFSSATFLFCFFPVAVIGYFILPKQLRNVFLALISVGFYAWGELKFVFMMLLSIVVNWAAALVIEKRKSTGTRRGKKILFLTVGLNLLLLVVFKYLNFTLQSLNAIAPIFPQTSIALPIGISFFTFQAISYVVDVYRGHGKAQKNLLNVVLYVSFFPQLIAGPIVRYETIAAEIEERKTTWDDFCEGVERFLRGVFKKILLSNNLAVLADVAFGTAYGELSVTLAWTGALAYTLQIFFDFSGYSDMAIGLGRMFGFHFNENFDYPYISKSVTEFWRRWHISLGTWFRDYVYIPLGGSRVSSTARHVFNLFVVWLLTGFWHGASWNFVVWGLMYFVLLIVEKYVVKPEDMKKPAAIYSWQAFTILSVVVGWVFFRAVDLQSGGQYLLSMLGIGVPMTSAAGNFYIKEYMVFLVAGILLSVPIIPWLKGKLGEKSASLSMELGKAAAYLLLFVVSVSYIVIGFHNPFIYFNF